MQNLETLRQTPQSELRTLRQRHARHLLRVVTQLLNPDAVRPQKSDIKLHVVTYQPRTTDELVKIVAYGVPIRRRIHICLRDSRQRNDELRQPLAWIDQGMKNIDLLIATKLYRTDVDNPIRCRIQTGGL